MSGSRGLEDEKRRVTTNKQQCYDSDIPKSLCNTLPQRMRVLSSLRWFARGFFVLF